MARMYLVRHAQASFGAEDYDNLSDLGHQQSLLLGEYFNNKSVSFDSVITGDMLRHKQTAQGILVNQNVQHVHHDDAWNEFDFESIVAAFLTLHPHKKPAADAPRSEWYKVLKQAMLCWSKGELALPNSETWQGFCDRVLRGTNDILASENKSVLVVTSGGAMAVFLMHMFGTTVEKAIEFNLQIKNTSVNELFFNRRGFQLNSFNNVPHLDTSEHLSKVTYS
jgi:broad specificity phosphatase PhoE